MSVIYISDSLPVPVQSDVADFERADLVFYGVEHTGPSYEGRVFLGVPDANESTPLDSASGYAGSFYVFGHAQGCFGDDGHCEVPDADDLDPFDLRLSHHLVPFVINVVITESLKLLRDAEAEEFVVTVVPVIYNDPDPDKPDVLAKEGVFVFERLSLVTYD